ncbi:Ppx/GppA family phosphatase, partial [bacterium]
MKGSTKRFAAIDIGTNTILLLIAELGEDGTFRLLDDRAEITRLGEGVDRTRRIGSDGEERSVQVLKGYLERCGNLAVEEIVAVGTSALRDARNAENFKARLKQELGWDLRVLSGEEEAAYSYLAVQRGLALEGKEVLVVDVGGGSTEFIWGRGGASHRSISLNLGSVRLTERFLISDPVREEECARLAMTIDRELEPLRVDWTMEGRFQTMVGIAGTFTTLVAIEKGLRQYSHSEVHGSLLYRAEVLRQIQLFKTKTIAERREIPGLEPKRADVILAGAMLIERIMAL